MKKLLTLALALLLAPAALGQSVGASQIKKKANAGLVADSANALALGIYRGTSAPASPVTGQAWLDTSTTPATMKTYTGSTWEISPTAAGITQADLTAFPSTPSDGQIVWVKSLKRAVIYEATAAKWYYLDGTGRSAQADYSLVTAGFPSTFLPGAGSTSATTLVTGSMTLGTHVCAVSYYNSAGGETLPGPSSAPFTITTGVARTGSLTFGASVTGSAGKRVWCSKSNATSPLWLITSIDDTSTTTYDVTIADSSFLTQTAPDVDFSAAIPAGWTVLNLNRLEGGCGSTGTSLLCACYVPENSSVGSSSPRLFYDVTGSSGAFRVAMRVSRYDSGFAGNTAGGISSAAVGLMSATTSDTATPANATAIAGAVGWIRATRTASGSLWSSTGTTFTATEAFSLPTTTPFYAQLASFVSGNAYSRWQISANGLDWNPAMYNETAAEYLAIGIAAERISGTGLGGVIAIDDFTFRSE